MKKRKSKAQGVQSLDTGLAVAFAVARAGKPVSLTDIASQLGMLPSTAHRHLASLSRAGLVEQSGRSGRYDLGPAAIDLGFSALRRLDTHKLWNDAIERLRDETDLTSMSIVWGNLGPTVIQWKESRKPVWLNAHIGTVLPITRSAGGLVFCAYPPSQDLPAMVAREFRIGPAPTNHGRKLTARRLETLVAKVRKSGYADIDGDVLDGVAAASAPVFDRNGGIKVALSVLGPSRLVNLDPKGPHIRALLETARWLSKRLGQFGPA